MTDVSQIDQNSRGSLTAVSNVDGTSIVKLYADPVTHRLLTSAVSTANIIIGTSTITSGTTGLLLYDNAGVVGELALTTYPSLTELSYVKGVTSGIQSQLNAKGSGSVTTVSVATANGFSGTVANATTVPAITIIAGAITPTSVNGLIVGYGNGAVNTNTAVGVGVLAGANSGTGNNTAIGYSSLAANTTGYGNTGVGLLSLTANTEGAYNTANGDYSLYHNTTGSNNTGLGAFTLNAITTNSGNVAIGFSAGKYETGSDAFYVDNQDRTNTAGDKAKALMYGTFNATAASQTLAINAAVNALVSYSVAGTKVVGAQVASIGLNAKTDTNKITDIIAALRAHGLLGPNA